MERERAATTDAYLAGLPADQRAALARLRATIRAAAPGAEECISYGLPAFRRGKVLVAYGASASHCALYPLSPALVAALAEELARFDTSKGTIRFRPEAPLPVALVRKIVKARLREIGASGSRRASAVWASNRAPRPVRKKKAALEGKAEVCPGVGARKR